METNSKSYLLFLILTVVFFVIGLINLLFPDFVRKYDKQLTRYIKNKDDYNLSIRLFGVLSLLISASFFMVGLLQIFRTK